MGFQYLNKMNGRFLESIPAFVMAILFFSGCSLPDPKYYTFLTAECLESESLSTKLTITGESFNFYFKPIMDYREEGLRIKGLIPTIQGAKDVKVTPPQWAFSAFGSQATAISKEYDQLFDDFWDHKKAECVTTIYYDEGIILTADKDFGGHKAGENLIPFGSIIDYNSVLVPSENCYIPLLDKFKADYMVSASPLGPFFTYPCGGHKIVDEDVTFTIKVPVKAVMYLKWLGDRLNNPDAEIPVEEKVLTGTFNIQKGLQ